MERIFEKDLEGYDLSEKPKSVKVPQGIEKEWGLKDGDLLLMEITPTGRGNSMRTWSYLTSGCEITIPKWIRKIADSYDSSKLEISIKAKIPGREGY